MSNRGDNSGWLRDQNKSFGGGLDGGRSAGDIDRNQVSLASNCTMRGDRIKPRPAYIKRILSYGNDANLALAFQRGRFQVAGFYDGNGSPALLSSHSGRQFRIDLNSFVVSEITPINNSSVNTTANFVMPAAAATVAIHVTSTADMLIELPSITVGGYPMTLITIDSTTQITARNNSGVVAPTITANLVLSGTLGHTSTVTVSSTAAFGGPNKTIIIGGKTLSLVSIGVGSITVSNVIAAQVGITIASGASITIPGSGNPVGATINFPVAVGFAVYDSNSSDIPLNWQLQAEKYWILQDNRNAAIIYDGSSSRRSNPNVNEIPVGNVMEYAMGRIAVALPDRRTYRVGDIVFGSSGTAKNNYIDAILKFTENNYANEGGDFVARVFGAPSNSGNILAMKASAMTDTQLGQGPMSVGTPFGWFTVNLPFDRTTWKNLSNPLQTYNPIPGPTGQNSTVLVNTDLWYRSMDGIRSYIMAQRQFTSGGGNHAQSNELGDILDYDTGYLLEHGSAAYFSNRLMMTISPVDSDRGVYHRGLAVIDFNLASGLRKNEPPAWEGVWTDLWILQIVHGIINGVDRCFFYAVNADNHIELWELDEESKSDYNDTPINWSWETPSYNCGDSDRFKKLEVGRMVVNGLSGTLGGTVKFRNDLSPCYYPWDTFSVCAKRADCVTSTDCAPHTYQEQERTPIKLVTPADTMDTIAGRMARTGYEFQARFEMVGYGEVSSFTIYCQDQPEGTFAERTRT